jgi:MoaD family protein
MRVSVHFYSYFKELTGCAQTTEDLAEGGTIDDLLQKLIARFPKLGPLQKSMLIAVGVEYQARDHALKEGDEVSLFPPVQGG